MSQQQVDAVVAGLVDMMGARLVRDLRDTGRRKCAKKIADLPLGISFSDARDLVVTEENRLFEQIGKELTLKQEAVLLAKFYRGVNEAADETATSLLVEYSHKRAELLSGQIGFNPEADYE